MMVMAAGAGLANPPFGIGKPAPDFTAVDIDGKTQSLRQYRGKIVVLDWANPACPIDDGKHYQSGNIPSMQKQAAAQGIVWLTINSSAKGMPGAGDEYVGERLKAWQESVHWSAASYIQDRSGAIGRSYHASTTPQMYLIDKDGLLRYAGAIDSVPSSDPADIPKRRITSSRRWGNSRPASRCRWR